MFAASQSIDSRVSPLSLVAKVSLPVSDVDSHLGEGALWASASRVRWRSIDLVEGSVSLPFGEALANELLCLPYRQIQEASGPIRAETTVHIDLRLAIARDAVIVLCEHKPDQGMRFIRLILSDPVAQPIDQMLAVRFEHDLTARPRTGEQEVCEVLLEPWVQMQFWLFENDQCAGLGEEAKENDRQNLADANPHRGQVHFTLKPLRRDTQSDADPTSIL